MTTVAGEGATLATLDDATRRLVRLAAIIASADEQAIRASLTESIDATPVEWIEELILQSYLFCGFPRSLNAMREWRRLTGRPAPATADIGGPEWRRRGEATCRLVYGAMYERLRVNIRALHPELDDWMIVEGYGKVLSRPGLDLARRELCIVAACAASAQDRQLHSHLHGALNVGVAPRTLTEALDALEGVVAEDRLASTRMLWRRVQGQLSS
ncbi:MAG TPA: carboxymuconolactone decarboxylase family protein [Gemmatimonadaceae bacterium]